MDKECTTCHNKFPATVEFFFRHKNKPDGLTCQCKTCHTKSVSAWIAKNPRKRKAYMRNARLRMKWNLHPDDYAKMLADQGGVCALCGKPEKKRRKLGGFYSLAVDHDHKTGTIRKLLCSSCNNALGAFEDSPDLLRKAADYIEHHRYM